VWHFGCVRNSGAAIPEPVADTNLMFKRAGMVKLDSVPHPTSDEQCK